ncbi:non-hydrolyzing UDP-N-acetylglucosamine 2-epimerase [Salininema proteolyticum]|uniref:Non-hydrolyzing UDP-N-acetylglucosamine 2-epimerase n=1 Tax=Salininema proteolyticum TaxID=1607685 RepID=A0ABV8TX20_9ACTN
MRLISVVGARPQFVKLAPIAAAAEKRGVDHIIVHTGQHYDHRMSDVFFQGLSIPAPTVNLDVGSGSHAAQTGAMMTGLEREFGRFEPDCVLVYGDTNSTLAAALAAVKIHVPVAHLEAGLRSHNRAMPEEHNRVLSDHASDLLLAPTEAAVENLGNEGLAERTVLTGDVMTDVCLATAQGADSAAVAAALGVVPGEYVLSTIHRAETTDDPARLAAVVDKLATSPLPVVLPVHPRLRAKAEQAGVALDRGSLRLVEPLGYADMVAAVSGARSVVTDSGGLQKECFLLDTPCITVRTETEWGETLTGEWNVLVPDASSVSTSQWESLLTRTPDPAVREGYFPYGKGDAAVASVEAIDRFVRSRR